MYYPPQAKTGLLKLKWMLKFQGCFLLLAQLIEKNTELKHTLDSGGYNHNHQGKEWYWAHHCHHGHQQCG